jgi:murein DD-endopeptidase MepM/ murein hydrolase activator NlpD
VETPKITAPAGPTSPGQSYQLVKLESDPKVYLVKDGVKHHIQGDKDFENLGLKWGDIKKISASELNRYVQGEPINQSNLASYKQQLSALPKAGGQVPGGQPIAPQPDIKRELTDIGNKLATSFIQSPPAGQSYQLVKLENDPKVYLVKDGAKHHIESPKDVADLGLDLKTVKEISAPELNRYVQGGSINQSNVASYKQQISGQTQTPVSSPPPVTTPPPLQTPPPVSSGQPYQLVKLENDPKVYLVKDGVKHHIESPKDVADLGLNLTNVQTMPTAHLNAYAQGSSINQSNVASFKQQISTLPKAGDRVSTGQTVPQQPDKLKSELADIGKTLTTLLPGSQLPVAPDAYQLVKSPDNPTVYAVKDRMKYPVASAEDFNALGLGWSQIKEIPSNELNSFATAKESINASNRVDMAVKLGLPIVAKSPGSDTVYYVKGGEKHAIQSSEAFEALGFNWNKIQTLPDATINRLPMGVPINQSNMEYSQQPVVVKSPNDPKVYLLKDGTKHYIQGDKDFEALGFDWKEVKTLPGDKINSIPTGYSINQSNVEYSQKPMAVKAPNDPKVFLVKDGTKHHIQTPKDLKALGLDRNSIKSLPENKLNSLTTGEPINQSNVANYSQQLLGRPMPGYQVSSSSSAGSLSPSKYPLSGWQQLKRGYDMGDKTYYSPHHLGLDVMAPKGTPIYAWDNLKVTNTLYGKDGGNTIWINYDGKLFRILHMDQAGKTGEFKKGEIIGYVGNTGTKGGQPHMHIDISKNGKLELNNYNNFIDPEKYFKEINNKQ